MSGLRGVVTVGMMGSTTFAAIFGTLGTWAFGVMDENILRSLPYDEVWVETYKLSLPPCNFTTKTLTAVAVNYRFRTFYWLRPLKKSNAPFYVTFYNIMFENRGIS